MLMTRSTRVALCCRCLLLPIPDMINQDCWLGWFTP